jgi:beta-galactosidase
MSKSLHILITCLLATISSFSQSLPRELRFDDNWHFSKDSITTLPIHLPHDWSIEDTTTTAAWYKKTFTLPNTNNNTIAIRFDGIATNSDIYLNGHHLGHHPHAYTPATYTLTPYLAAPGNPNTITVRVNTPTPSHGAGIYRHVFLLNLPPDHIDVENTFITTSLHEDSAILLVQSPLPANTTIHLRLLDENNITVSESNTHKLAIRFPQLWAPGQPYLYKTEITLLKGQKTVDKIIIPTGIREVKIDAKNGLTINGMRTLLKGVCIQPGNSLLGIAAFDDAETRKISLLKQNGFNAIRTAHYPPSPKLLQVCDSLGILVIDESTEDLPTIIHRDRNHPAVIMWSIGNDITKSAVDLVKSLDPTRYTTAAINDARDSTIALLDVAGYNHMWANYFIDKRRVPSRIMYGSETYPADLQNAWNQVEGLPFVIGDFLDSDSADLDITGEKKPTSYYRDIVWRRSPIEILVHKPDSITGEQASWTWPGHLKKPIQVRVFSRSPFVKLKQNDMAIETKATNPDLSATFEIPYKPGQLVAVALDHNKKEVGVKTLATATTPTLILLHADTSVINADPESLAYISINLLDNQEHIVPNAAVPLNVSISGPATLVATSNGNPPHGKGLIILRNTGKKGTIKVKVTGQNLQPGTISVKVK